MVVLHLACSAVLHNFHGSSTVFSSETQPFNIMYLYYSKYCLSFKTNFPEFKVYFHPILFIESWGRALKQSVTGSFPVFVSYNSLSSCHIIRSNTITCNPHIWSASLEYPAVIHSMIIFVTSLTFCPWVWDDVMRVAKFCTCRLVVSWRYRRSGSIDCRYCICIGLYSRDCCKSTVRSGYTTVSMKGCCQ